MVNITACRLATYPHTLSAAAATNNKCPPRQWLCCVCIVHIHVHRRQKCSQAARAEMLSLIDNTALGSSEVVGAGFMRLEMAAAIQACVPGTAAVSTAQQHT